MGRGWAINKGSLTAPEDSDDGSSDDDSNIDSTRASIGQEDSGNQETDALLHQRGGWAHRPLSQTTICLAGYILSDAATNITVAIGISDVLSGVIILAIATTLPEKFVAVMRGHRGHIGIVANAVGSNVFLLSLYMGIIMLDTSGEFNSGNVNVTEPAVLWASILAFTLTGWFGSRFDRWIGDAMLAGYVAFIVLELTVIHNVADTPRSATAIGPKSSQLNLAEMFEALKAGTAECPHRYEIHPYMPKVDLVLVDPAMP
ncbi:hypothetical protein MRS44_013945 [Fusarium solani]|uniref:uncharacterized protein n=1 Tax=Fusarium solani TaxID=169388 RepID=UPI0032C41540|nr:hypothetical protein MRS44_013816 [Fusarium solani]KAJ3455345.1 hypothetical protein MRS44_013945 [Fusarium solani]